MHLTDECERYLDACASIRRISKTRLIERMVSRICQDQLMLAVLDDDSKQPHKLSTEKTRSYYHRNMPYE